MQQLPVVSLCHSNRSGALPWRRHRGPRPLADYFPLLLRVAVSPRLQGPGRVRLLQFGDSGATTGRHAAS